MRRGARTTMYRISILLFLFSSLTHLRLMPFIPSSPDPTLSITPSLPLLSPISDEPVPIKFPSSSDKMDQSTASDLMNPYRLIALKARQATKERIAKRKARLLERSSHSSGRGSNGVASSWGSSLGSGSFPRQRSQWDTVQQASTSIPAPTTWTGESSESRSGRDLHDSRSLPPNLGTTLPSWKQYQLSLNDSVPSPTSTRVNNISQDTTMEEEDDDADLKKLMNQAQAMLNISGNQAHSESKSQEHVITPRVPTRNEVQMGGTSLLADPNDERR